MSELRSCTSSIEGPQPCRRFKFSEIMIATGNFDESLVIGHEGFGKVYKGEVYNGLSLVAVAIKRLDSMSSQGAAEFWAEVKLLSKLRHCNLVSLIGYCYSRKEMIIVYEYMPNGTLEDHLHKLGTPLSWVQRLKICIGAGRGLHYLHTGTRTDVGVVHRDVKSSNILLDESWVAKISDFGLSRISPINRRASYVNTLVKGTFGYLDPDYFYTGRLTRKSDVYAFGVVLLEVLCRKRAVDRSLDEDHWNLARWVQESIKEGNLKRIIDTDIRSQISPKCLKEFVRIADRCLHSNPKERPTMAEVVVSLESLVLLQEKSNNYMQISGTNIFARMVDMFAFPNKAKKSGPDMLVGDGGFGNAFLGWFDKNTFTPSKRGDGVAVAVKEYFPSTAQGCDQRLAVSLLGRLDHPNVISLLGYCDDKKQGQLLVYEYVQNQNFGQLLSRDAPESLSWETRLRIMIGVAHGVAYLHASKVICRGLKSSNIWLDQDFNAKLGDFGLEMEEIAVTTRVQSALGHFNPYFSLKGYSDPYYCLTGHWSVKSDIYGFGVLLLESLSGLRLIDEKRPNKQVNLITWASQLNRRNLKEIMDPRLEQNYPVEDAYKCTALALRCLASAPRERPSSEEVMQSLEEIYFVSE
ncbi:putative transferase, protein kinase RLK-Pelle-RLCK-VIIa-2 family protein [Tanacetum coccineum]